MDKDKFYKLVHTQLNLSRDELKPEASLVDDLGADSFDIAELIHAVEIEYKIEVKEADVPNLVKIKDFLTYIEKKELTA